VLTDTQLLDMIEQYGLEVVPPMVNPTWRVFLNADKLNRTAEYVTGPTLRFALVAARSRLIARQLCPEI
jgi:hypothetical protein